MAGQLGAGAAQELGAARRDAVIGDRVADGASGNPLAEAGVDAAVAEVAELDAEGLEARPRGRPLHGLVPAGAGHVIAVAAGGPGDVVEVVLRVRAVGVVTGGEGSGQAGGAESGGEDDDDEETAHGGIIASALGCSCRYRLSRTRSSPVRSGP